MANIWISKKEKKNTSQIPNLKIIVIKIVIKSSKYLFSKNNNKATKSIGSNNNNSNYLSNILIYNFKANIYIYTRSIVIK